MAQFKIDTEVLDSANGRLMSQNTQLKEIIKKMGTEVANLEAVWTGTAQKSFEAKFNELKSKVLDLSKVIDDYGKAMKQAANNYRETETANQMK